MLEKHGLDALCGELGDEEGALRAGLVKGGVVRQQPLLQATVLPQWQCKARCGVYQYIACERRHAGTQQQQFACRLDTKILMQTTLSYFSTNTWSLCDNYLIYPDAPGR